MRDYYEHTIPYTYKGEQRTMFVKHYILGSHMGEFFLIRSKSGTRNLKKRGNKWYVSSPRAMPDQKLLQLIGAAIDKYLETFEY